MPLGVGRCFFIVGGGGTITVDIRDVGRGAMSLPTTNNRGNDSSKETTEGAAKWTSAGVALIRSVPPRHRLGSHEPVGPRTIVARPCCPTPGRPWRERAAGAMDARF